MKIKKATRFGLVLLCAVLGMTSMAWSYQNDYAQDVAINSNPSPRDTVTGSSVNQYGTGETNSQIDNYLNQDEQINLDKDSGVLRVLRTNQKALINDYVTELVEFKNINPRELRGLARTLCRKEGGDADVLHDKVNKREYMVIVCPKFQVEYVTRTLQALDQPWVSEWNDGSWIYYYKAQNRDVRTLESVMRFHHSPDSQREFDDANNAIIYYDQPNIKPLIMRDLPAIDIPPSQITLDVEIFEVDTQNDLALGFDWESWKNGPGQNLFEFIFWDFDGGDSAGLFPGSGPRDMADWGRYRSYNVPLTTAYIDFLQSKGKARLMTRGSILTESGWIGNLAAVDELNAFQSETDNGPMGLAGKSMFRVSEIYDNYYKDYGLLSQGELLKQSNATIISTISSLLSSIGASSADVAEVVDELTERAADGTLDRDDLEQTTVAMSVVLASLRNRTMQYRQTSQPIGVLLTILPVVGLESAEMALTLDVSDVTGMTPNGTPIIEHRHFSSSIEVANGLPFVLGGIRKTTEVKSASGIPFLRDIPWLGYAFGREVTTKREKEVVVVLRPRFQVCATSTAEPPEELETAVKLATGEKELEVPANSYFFDQWLLDEEKQ